jgi:hypothetical protein
MFLYITTEKEHLTFGGHQNSFNNFKKLNIMKKVMVLLAAFMLLGSVGAFAGKSIKISKSEVKKNSVKKIKDTQKKEKVPQQCIATVYLSCGSASAVGNCNDFYCITDWGWELIALQLELQFCSPNQPKPFTPTN